MKRIPTLAFVGFFTALAFIFLFSVTRFAYLPNTFLQSNHIVIGLIFFAIAVAITIKNYHPGKKG